MKDPGNKTSPAGNEEPVLNSEEQSVVTNADESAEEINNDGLTVDTNGIQETLSESQPSLEINVDRNITNNDPGAAGVTDDTAI